MKNWRTEEEEKRELENEKGGREKGGEGGCW